MKTLEVSINNTISIFEIIKSHNEPLISESGIKNEFDALAAYSYKTAQRVRAKAIICITRDGNTALRLSSFQIEIPIIAITFKEQTVQKLKMIRGIYSIFLPLEPSNDKIFDVIF